MRKIITLNILLIICLSIASCYEPEEGCLDVLSSNYSIDADSACEDCCVYPTLSIRVRQQYDTLSVSKLDTFTNSIGQDIVFHNLEILAHDFKMVSVSDQVIAVSDSIDVSSTIDGVEVQSKVPDDVIFIRPTRFSYALGQFTYPDTYKSISMQVGLSDTLNYVDRSELDSEDVLNVEADTLYISETAGFVFARLEVQTDPTDSMSLVTYDLYGDNVNYSHHWNIDTTYVRGNDIEVELLMDYKDWLFDIDWSMEEQAVLSALELQFGSLFQ